jgi:hypothetical protein
MQVVTNILRQVAELRRMPRASVNLMLSSAAAENDSFYAGLVRQHYAQARRLHRKYWVIRQGVYGVALCVLPESFDKYYYVIEAAARRNHKKAIREGCRVERIDYNAHLDGIREIWQSTDVRQGSLMPEKYLRGDVRPCANPPSRSRTHDYVHFGVFLKDKLIGYSGCLIAGEYCGIETIFGHADHLPIGPVPSLVIGTAAYLYDNHPAVKYYCYGTYFGAGETMKRFKRKFGFVPHRVEWLLDRDRRASAVLAAAPALAAAAMEGGL